MERGGERGEVSGNLNRGKAYPTDCIFWGVDAVVEKSERIGRAWGWGRAIDDFRTGRFDVVL